MAVKKHAMLLQPVLIALTLSKNTVFVRTVCILPVFLAPAAPGTLRWNRAPANTEISIRRSKSDPVQLQYQVPEGSGADTLPREVPEGSGEDAC